MVEKLYEECVITRTGTKEKLQEEIKERKSSVILLSKEVYCNLNLSTTSFNFPPHQLLLRWDLTLM